MNPKSCWISPPPHFDQGDAIDTAACQHEVSIRGLASCCARRLRRREWPKSRRSDQQVSLTDPDARSMATSGRGTGMVGYNVQTAVDAEHHLIVAHEVTNVGHDRTQHAPVALSAGSDGLRKGHGAGRSRLFQRRAGSGV